jgi:hypothetical protein
VRFIFDKEGCHCGLLVWAVIFVVAWNTKQLFDAQHWWTENGSGFGISVLGIGFLFMMPSDEVLEEIREANK